MVARLGLRDLEDTREALRPHRRAVAEANAIALPLRHCRRRWRRGGDLHRLHLLAPQVRNSVLGRWLRTIEQRCEAGRIASDLCGLVAVVDHRQGEAAGT
jgi:hypothetical protein